MAKVSKEELKRKAAYKKRKISWPLVVFVAILLGVVGFAATWQKNRDPERRANDAATGQEKKSETASILEEAQAAQSIPELDSLAKNVERNYQSSTEPGQFEILRTLTLIAERRIAISTDQVESQLSKAKLLEYLNLLLILQEKLKFDSQDLRQRIVDLSNELIQSTVTEANNVANVSRITLAGTDLVADPTNETRFQTFRENLLAAVRKHPEDFRVSGVIATYLDGFSAVESLPKEKLVGLISDIIAAYGSVSNPSIRDWVSVLHDNQRFAEHKYRELLYACEIDSPGAVDELMSAIQRIIEGKLAPRSLARLVAAGNVLENRQNPEAAKQLYELLQNQIPTPANEEYMVVANACENGLKRIALLAKDFDFGGTDFKGIPFTADRFLGNAALIIYVSSEADVEFVKKMLVDFRSNIRRGLSVITVFLDIDDDQIKYQFKESDLRLMTLVCDPDRHGAFARQCPVDMMPYLVLINSRGVVEKVAVDPAHLYSELDSLMNHR